MHFRMTEPQSPQSFDHRAAAWNWRFLAAIVLPLLVVIGQSIYLWDFSIDDVGISWRYARHLADGHGLTWNLEGPPVEGYSNLLWVLMIAVPGAFGMDIESASKVLGVLFAAANVILFGVILRRLFPDSRYWWAPLWIVALMPEWTLWDVSGLEIALFGFFGLLSVYALTRESGRAVYLAIALGGLTLTRPEGFAVGIVILATLFAMRTGSGWRERWEDIKRPAIALIITLAALVGFRLWYFGYPLPNTVYAKFSLMLPAAKHVGMWILVIVPFIAAWILIEKRPRTSLQRSVLEVAGVAALIHTAMILPVHPVMNFLHRYHVALLPLWLLAVPFALDVIARKRTAFAVLACGAILLWSAQGWPAVLERVEVERYQKRVQRCIVSALKELPGTPTIAIIDAGLIPYRSDLPTIDAWGLCDVEIAHEASPQVSVMKRAPAVYITSVDSLIYGFERPRLGADKLMYHSGNFAQVYRLWRPCVGGERPSAAAYDYAILVLARWARDNDVRIPERKEFWDIAPVE